MKLRYISAFIARLAPAAAIGTVLTLAAPLGACDSGGGGDPFVCEVEPTLTSLQGQYFMQSCTFSGCHNTVDHEGDLDLQSAGLHARLVDVDAVNEKAAERGKKLVTASDSPNSFLLQKVIATMELDEGPLMPDGADEPVQPDCGPSKLSEWIQAGALDN